MINSTKPLGQRGSVLVAIILMFPFLALIAALYMGLSVSSFQNARSGEFRTHAQLATDAGLDIALQEINNDNSWLGTAGEVEVNNNSEVRTTYEITVADVGDNKEVTGIGRTYSPVGNTTPDSTITIKVDLRPVTSGNFSLVTGVGGLYMTNNSKILGGDVHVNGEISMTNSAQIGLSSNPANLSVANQNCPDPPDATYPRICNEGESPEPIEMLLTSHIFGDVQANNQVDGSGMSDPGLTAGSGVSALPLPPHDRDAQKAAVAVERTGSDASCWGSQTKTWAANTKINGDVNLSNSCQVTVEGDVWITGNFNMSNSTQIRVADSLGGTRPNIMIDGSNGVTFSNSSTLVSNSSDTGFQVITYWSDTTCTPDCTDVTGQDLYDSRDRTTISLSNNAEGPHTIFYARWSRVLVNNSGQIGALVGQTVRMSNSATITFGTSVGTSTTYWVIDGYRRVF